VRGFGHSRLARPVALNDETTIATTIAVAGAQPYLWDVDLETSILHGYPGDLRIRLQSPQGTTVVISTDNGAGNPEVLHGTLWDDDADPGSPVPYTVNPKIVSDHVFTLGPRVPFLVPEGALAAFLGEDPNGTWTLTIEDDAAGGEGTLESWDLHLATLASPPAFTLNGSYSNSVPMPLPDLVVATSTIEVPAGLGLRLLRVTAQTFIEHTFGEDLEITLTSPAGTVVTLTSDSGEEADDIFNGTVWDDDAPDATSDYVFQNGMPAVHWCRRGDRAFLGEDPRAPGLTIADVLAVDEER
jgi:subtilisin-like proprotein convertase family protein